MTLSPTRTGSSLRMILLLALGSWGVLWIAVKIGVAIVRLIGGAL